MSDTIYLAVPKLVAQPVLSAGCCAVLAADIVADDLMAMPGMHPVAVAEATGIVTVIYDPVQINPGELEAVLAGLGYPSEVAGGPLAQAPGGTCCSGPTPDASEVRRNA